MHIFALYFSVISIDFTQREYSDITAQQISNVCVCLLVIMLILCCYVFKYLRMNAFENLNKPVRIKNIV